jgi:hypothetical protein
VREGGACPVNTEPVSPSRRSCAAPPGCQEEDAVAAGKKTSSGAVRNQPQFLCLPSLISRCARTPQRCAAVDDRCCEADLATWRSRGKEGATAIGGPKGRRPRASLRQLSEIPTTPASLAERRYRCVPEPRRRSFPSTPQSMPSSC